MATYSVAFSGGKAPVRISTFRAILEAIDAADLSMKWVYRIEKRSGGEAMVQIWSDVYGLSRERMTRSERRIQSTYRSRKEREKRRGT